MDNYPYLIKPPKRALSACWDPLWFSRRRHAAARRGCGAACSCWYCSGDAALSVPLPLMPHRCRYPDCACAGAVLSCVRLCCVLGRGASSLRFYPWITAALLSRHIGRQAISPKQSLLLCCVCAVAQGVLRSSGRGSQAYVSPFSRHQRR